MNKTVSLIRYAKTGNGWRRGAVVIGKSGRLKPDYMMLGGREVHCPEGRYQLIRYEGTKPIYTDLGNDATDALARYRAEESKASAKVAAMTAGLELVDDGGTRKTLRQYVADFLAMHRALPHRSDDSVSVYTAITALFLEVCTAIGSRYPEDVSKENVIRFYAAMCDKQWDERTRANRYMSLRGFLRYCEIDPKKLIDKGTHALLKKYTKRKPNNYTPEVVEKLIAASTDENRALLWDFAYKTGLRDSELRMVTRYDLHGLDGDNPTLHVKERDEYGRIKDAEERIVELHPSLVPRLRAWLRENPKRVLLFGTVNDRPDTKMLLALKVSAKRAGLNCGRCIAVEKGKQVSCKDRPVCHEFTLHRFRRTYTTRLLRATGGDLRSVMERTGHADMASVMRYLEPAASVRQAVNTAF